MGQAKLGRTLSGTWKAQQNRATRVNTKGLLNRGANRAGVTPDRTRTSGGLGPRTPRFWEKTHRVNKKKPARGYTGTPFENKTGRHEKTPGVF